MTNQAPLTPAADHSMLSASSSFNTPSSGLTKRESYKDRRKTYQIAKKKGESELFDLLGESHVRISSFVVAEELLSTISDPTVVVLADWLKGAP